LGRCCKPDGEPGVLKASAKGYTRLDVSARTVRKDSDSGVAASYGRCVTQVDLLSRLSQPPPNSLELRRRGILSGCEFPTPSPVPSLANRAASPVSSCETLGSIRHWNKGITRYRLAL